jgi:hypothetical protein
VGLKQPANRAASQQASVLTPRTPIQNFRMNRIAARLVQPPDPVQAHINQPLQDFFAVAMAYNVKLLRAVPLNYFTYFLHWQTLVGENLNEAVA